MTRHKPIARYKLEQKEQAKECPNCKQKKDYDHFTKNKSSYDGKSTYCRDCQNAKGKLVRAKNKEEARAARRASHAETLIPDNKKLNGNYTGSIVEPTKVVPIGVPYKVSYDAKIDDLEKTMANLAIYINNLNDRLHRVEKIAK
jgi:hypothetical protein